MNKKELLYYLSSIGFSKKIINAFEKVKRENFVPENLKDLSYEDTALPLQEGATISQPSTIAFMLDLLNLEGKEKVLEIGSGSGYVLALLSHLTKGKIYGVEIITSLAERSRKILEKNKQIEIYNKDGSKSFSEKAPFDRVLISASADKLPEHLYDQLSQNGIIVASVKNSIFCIKKKKTITKKEYPGFVFVPLR